MKISVIIPSYKPQSYLWECLDSVCNQTFPKDDYEVIVILNGCDEPYNGQIKEYISKHTDVNWNYIQIDRGGVSNARNLALDVAKGEYVAFIDDDDYVSSSYLEELYAHSDNETIALSNAYAFKDGSPDTWLPYEITKAFYAYSPKGRIKSCGIRRFFSGAWMKLINVNFICKRRFDVRFKNGEDSLFMFLISDRVKYVEFTSSDAIYYRRYRENSAVTSHKSRYVVIVNSFKLIICYTSIYFRNLSRYNIRHYIRSIFGAFHTMVDKTYILH